LFVSLTVQNQSTDFHKIRWKGGKSREKKTLDVDVTVIPLIQNADPRLQAIDGQN